MSLFVDALRPRHERVGCPVSQRTGQQSDDATHDVEANGENGIGDLATEGQFP
jgi:hypothetical protein